MMLIILGQNLYGIPPPTRTRMKIGLAQINTTVGDIPGNTAKIAAFLEKAQALGSDLVVFPELAVTGYPPRDLVEKRSLVAENIEALDRIAAVCDRAMALVGFVDRNASPVGKSVHNAAALVHRGRILDIYHKALLPTYDVFDEGRYFEPGDRPLVFECLGRRFGVTICEDTWIKQAALDRRLYRTDPLERFNGAGLDFLVNISASPFSLGKGEARQRIAAGLSGLTSSGFIYLNLVGGNDELIFDGGSFVMNPAGKTIAAGRQFEEDLVIVDLDLAATRKPARPAPNRWRPRRLECALRAQDNMPLRAGFWPKGTREAAPPTSEPEGASFVFAIFLTITKLAPDSFKL